jgi:hypothetical protein
METVPLAIIFYDSLSSVQVDFALPKGNQIPRLQVALIMLDFIQMISTKQS